MSVKNGERKMKILSVVAATAALGIALTPLCTPAEAAVQFLFMGQAEGGGNPQAEATLTLIDTYSFGSPITPANFVSFQYMSSDQQFTFDQITGSGPGLQALGSFVGEFMLFTKNGDDFEVVPDGTWVASDNMIDVGTGGQFTRLVGSAVPELSTWALMLLGFAALGYVGCRASRAGIAPQV
jgi:hypothetical protein